MSEKTTLLPVLILFLFATKSTTGIFGVLETHCMAFNALIRPAPSSPTRLGFAASMLSQFAVKHAFTSSGVRFGFRDNIRPESPATNGQAIDVPSMYS